MGNINPVRDDPIRDEIDPFLRELDPGPVLVDVGASAEVPSVWRPIAAHSIYVGFDPDLREMRAENGGQFRQAFVLNEAVTPAADGDGRVTFRLTRWPQCSSTLPPNRAVLANYLLPERFEVEGERAVPATTLDAALARLSLGRVDWLKLDTQGTDLRLFNSLSDAVRDRVLAVDAEPGLRGAYEGEDLFGDLHAGLVRQGFWCAAAAVKGLPRVRATTLAALTDDPPAAGAGADGRPAIGLTAEACGLPTCPGWVECRYLRTLESLAAGAAFGRRDYVLLWAFAHAAGQLGFAGDVALECERRFGADAGSAAMVAATARRLRAARAAHQAGIARQNGLAAKVRRRLRRLADRIERSAGRLVPAHLCCA